MRPGFAILAVCVLTAACSDSSGAAQGQAVAERAVSISTTACGHASKTTGSGVIIEDGRVLASAHVVIGADDVSVDGQSAQILKIDTQADLALLAVPGTTARPIEFTAAIAGDVLTIIDGGEGPSVTALVLRAVEVRIEEVRSTTRSSRLAYELDTRVALGQSGSGAFDAEGHLVGVVFGRIQNGENRSFVVHSEEIIDFLSNGEESSYRCDPEVHRVLPSE